MSMTTITRDPVAIALFELANRVRTPEQHRFIEAVIQESVTEASAYLESDHNGDLLPDDLLSMLSVWLASRASADMLQVFSDYGYGVDFRLPSSPAFQMTPPGTLGDLVMEFSDLQRHCKLLQSGYLRAERAAMTGMRHPAPEVFDFWADQYFIQLKPGAAIVEDLFGDIDRSVPPSPPTAGPEIFDWRPECLVSQGPLLTLQKEQGRRFARMLDGFLETYYPASSARQRWSHLLENPPVIVGAQNLESRISRLVAMLSHHLSYAPECREGQVRTDLTRRSGIDLTMALLQMGYGLNNFQGDPARELVCHMVRDLSDNTGRGITGEQKCLWDRISRRLPEENPRLWSVLPDEFRAEGRWTRIGSMSEQERLAFIEQMALSLGTAHIEKISKRSVRL